MQTFTIPHQYLYGLLLIQEHTPERNLCTRWENHKAYARSPREVCAP